MFLRLPEIARLVRQSLLDAEIRFHRYILHSFVIMPNHVHLLVTPHVIAKKWLGPLKGFAGHEANRLLGNHGYFWQDESYDHLVRGGTGFEQVRHYIEWNPVKAGLANSPEEFEWSSAAPGKSPACRLKA